MWRNVHHGQLCRKACGLQDCLHAAVSALHVSLPGTILPAHMILLVTECSLQNEYECVYSGLLLSLEEAAEGFLVDGGGLHYGGAHCNLHLPV